MAQSKCSPCRTNLPSEYSSSTSARTLTYSLGPPFPSHSGRHFPGEDTLLPGSKVLLKCLPGERDLDPTLPLAEEEQVLPLPQPAPFSPYPLKPVLQWWREEISDNGMLSCTQLAEGGWVSLRLRGAANPARASLSVAHDSAPFPPPPFHFPAFERPSIDNLTS